MRKPLDEGWGVLYPRSVRLATLEGGDVIIIGPFGMSAAVGRVASGGEVVWSRQVSGDPVGLWALAVSADDRIVVSFGPDTDASSLLVLDAEGEVLAAMTPKVGRYGVEILTLAATAEGGVVMAGGGRGGVGGLLVARLDPGLEPEWAFAAGRLPEDEEMPMVCAGPWPACADSVLDVAVAADGSVMAVGLGFYSSEVVGIAALTDAEGVYQGAAGVELAPTLSNTIGFAVAASSGGGWLAGFSTRAADSLLASLDAEGRLGSACEPFVDLSYTPREVSLAMEPYEVTLEAVDLELGPADVEDDDWPVSVRRVCE